MQHDLTWKCRVDANPQLILQETHIGIKVIISVVMSGDEECYTLSFARNASILTLSLKVVEGHPMCSGMSSCNGAIAACGNRLILSS